MYEYVRNSRRRLKQLRTASRVATLDNIPLEIKLEQLCECALSVSITEQIQDCVCYEVESPYAKLQIWAGQNGWTKQMCFQKAEVVYELQNVRYALSVVSNNENKYSHPDRSLFELRLPCYYVDESQHMTIERYALLAIKYLLETPMESYRRLDPFAQPKIMPLGKIRKLLQNCEDMIGDRIILHRPWERLSRHKVNVVATLRSFDRRQGGDFYISELHCTADARTLIPGGLLWLNGQIDETVSIRYDKPTPEEIYLREPSPNLGWCYSLTPGVLYAGIACCMDIAIMLNMVKHLYRAKEPLYSMAPRRDEVLAADPHRLFSSLRIAVLTRL